MIDDFFDLGWEARALLGSLAEELAEEKIERLKRKQGSRRIATAAVKTSPMKSPVIRD